MIFCAFRLLPYVKLITAKALNNLSILVPSRKICMKDMIGVKWILKTKLKPDSSVQNYKAKLSKIMHIEAERRNVCPMEGNDSRIEDFSFVLPIPEDKATKIESMRFDTLASLKLHLCLYSMEWRDEKMGHIPDDKIIAVFHLDETLQTKVDAESLYQELLTPLKKNLVG
ncbi:hypothetical protein ACH5RR_013031 [Cinchona calisaya]|uniref:Uncharacterized protein n=1 Tax=Cinchona calisaya TaxID=153742 RepID=A0ABD3A057_9GENT